MFGSTWLMLVDGVLLTTTPAVFGAMIVVLLRRRAEWGIWAATPVLLWPGTPTVVALAAATFVTALGLIQHRAGKAWVLMIAFVCVMWVTYALHGPPILVQESEAKHSLVAFLAYVILIPAIAAIRPRLKPLLRVTAISSVLVSAWLLAVSDSLGGRAALESYNSDPLGMAAGISVLLLATLTVVDRRWWMLPLPIPLLLFVQAQTRSALVVVLVGIGVMWLLRSPGLKRVFILLAGLALIPFASDLVAGVQSQFFSARDGDLEVQSRVDVLQLTVETALRNPIYGVGWRHLTDVSASELGVAINAHNDIALIAAEGGLIAVGLFLYVLLGAFRAPLDPTIKGLLVGCASALAMGNIVTDPRATAPLWILLGYAWSTRTGRDEDRAADWPPLSRNEGDHARVGGNWNYGIGFKATRRQSVSSSSTQLALAGTPLTTRPSGVLFVTKEAPPTVELLPISKF